MADLWPPECHPGTRSVLLPLWLGKHSFFNFFNRSMNKTRWQNWKFSNLVDQKRIPGPVFYLPFSWQALLICLEPTFKTRLVWSMKFVQNEATFCNLDSDLSWWSVRRWTWCVSRTILDSASCQPSNLWKVKMLSRSIKVLRRSENEIYEGRKMVKGIKWIGVEPFCTIT